MYINVHIYIHIYIYIYMAVSDYLWLSCALQKICGWTRKSDQQNGVFPRPSGAILRSLGSFWVCPGLFFLCLGRLLFSSIAMKFNRTPDRPCGIDLSISPELILLQAAPAGSTNQIMEDKQARNAARACVRQPNSQLMSCGTIWPIIWPNRQPRGRWGGRP